MNEGGVLERLPPLDEQRRSLRKTAPRKVVGDKGGAESQRRIKTPHSASRYSRGGGQTWRKGRALNNMSKRWHGDERLGWIKQRRDITESKWMDAKRMATDGKIMANNQDSENLLDLYY